MKEDEVHGTRGPFSVWINLNQLNEHLFYLAFSNLKSHSSWDQERRNAFMCPLLFLIMISKIAYNVYKKNSNLLSTCAI